MRRTGAARRDLERETLEVQTEWSSGLTAKTSRRKVRENNVIPGRTLGGEVLATTLSRDGADAGVVNWFPESRVLVWNLPGLTKGYIAPEHLKEYGGWPFTPDMEWLNIQIAAFHQFKTQIDKNGFVARRQPGWSDRVLQFVAPTLSANEPGCDGLHWLDGTVFRVLLRRPRSLLLQGWLHVQKLVADLGELEMRFLQHLGGGVLLGRRRQLG